MKPLAIPALLLTLSFPLPALDLQVPQELRPAWDRLTAAHPLPPGLESGAVTVTDRAEPGFRVVESSELAAVVKLWEPQPALTRDAARGGPVRLRPAGQVSLPDVMLAVDGLFPGDSGYPLQAVVSVGITGDDSRLRSWFESLPSAEPAVPIRWIGAVGDVMPARGADAALRGSAGPQRVFGDTLPLLRGVDLLLGNLEAAATARGQQARKTYTFRFDPRALDALAGAGFGYFSLANNHTFDYGREGFLDTLEALARAHIATSGAGGSLAEAERAAELLAGDTPVRVLSFAAYPVDRTGFDGRAIARARGDRPGTLWLDDEGLAAARRAFDAGSFNIALVHGGVEWSTAPSAEYRRACAALLDAGADLVLGSHPHVVHGLEAVDGKLVAYSLGNFLFPGMEGTPGGQDSVILRVGLAGRRIVAVQAVPVRLEGTTVRLAPREGILATVRERSRALAASAARGD